MKILVIKEQDQEIVCHCMPLFNFLYIVLLVIVISIKRKKYFCSEIPFATLLNLVETFLLTLAFLISDFDSLICQEVTQNGLKTLTSYYSAADHVYFRSTQVFENNALTL